jgi:hypothetical protein
MERETHFRSNKVEDGGKKGGEREEYLDRRPLSLFGCEFETFWLLSYCFLNSLLFTLDSTMNRWSRLELSNS